MNFQDYYMLYLLMKRGRSLSLRVRLPKIWWFARHALMFRNDQTRQAHWFQEQRHLGSRSHKVYEERKQLFEKAQSRHEFLCTSKEERPSIACVGPMVDYVRRQDRENEEKIKKLINTAYHVCKTECPFLDYPRLVVLQEKNDLDMGNFYRSDNAYRRYPINFYQYYLISIITVYLIEIS